MTSVKMESCMKKIIITILSVLLLLGLFIETASAASIGVTANISQALSISISNVGKSYTITVGSRGQTYTWANDHTVTAKANDQWRLFTEVSQLLTRTTTPFPTIPSANYQWLGGDQGSYISWTKIAGAGSAQTVKTGTFANGFAPTNGSAVPISLKLIVPAAQSTGLYTTTIMYTITAYP